MQFDFFVRSNGVWDHVCRCTDRALAVSIHKELGQDQTIAVVGRMEGSNVIGLRVYPERVG